MNPDDPLEQLKLLKAVPQSDPLEELKKLKGPARPAVAQADATATTGPHTKPLEGQMGHPIIDADPDPLPQRVAEALVSGFPGASRAVAGYRGLLSLMGVGHETPQEALDQQKHNVESMPWIARAPLQFAGGVPAAEVLAPLGVAGGGAVFGAAAGADQPAGSMKERALHTTVGAGLGAAGAKVGVAAAKGIGNAATRSGLTDKIASVVQKVSPKLAATMGTRGQVNDVLSERQDILDAIGVHPANPGKRVLSQIAATKDRASKLYAVARADKQPIQNPELNALLSDPQVRRAYQVASQIREVSGNPLPQEVIEPARAAVPAQPAIPRMIEGAVESPPLVPAPPRPSVREAVSQFQTAKGVAATRSEGTVAQRMAREALDRRSAEAALPTPAPRATGLQTQGPALPEPREAIPGQPAQPEVTADLPDPQVLSSLKRYLGHAAEGNMKSKFPVRQEEALALLPKVRRIRDILHETSPSWKQADAFYSDAKGQEEAFAHGFDAMRHANSPVGAKLKTQSPEAMLQMIEEPRYPGEPPAAMKARAEAFREGVKAFMAEQVRGTTVDKGLESILGRQSFAATAKAAQGRSLMFQNPEKSTALENLLSDKRGKMLSGKALGSGLPDKPHGGPISRTTRLAVRSVSKPDMINTGKGQSMLMDRLRSPSLGAGEVANFRAGEPASEYLKRLLSISAGGQLAR